MAIQLPDVGTGVPADKTGDSPWLAMKKVRENFSDQSNAASRLVGKGSGQLAEWKYVRATGLGGAGAPLNVDVGKRYIKSIANNYTTGIYEALGPTDAPTVLGLHWSILYMQQDISTKGVLLLASSDARDKNLYMCQRLNDVFSEYIKLYSTGNTTKEPTTGYLKAASPILHLFNDNLGKEHEAVEQDITVEKLGVGDYLIKGSTGLSSEGWSLSPPKDIHGNVLCMVEATESDGNINIKTYKRKFDFDIVAIVPDYDQPFDIPAGHSVDLRLNDLITEV